MGLTVNGLARDIDLPATRLDEIVHERRGATAETASTSARLQSSG